MSRVFKASISKQARWVWDGSAKPIEAYPDGSLGRQCPRFVRGDKLQVSLEGCKAVHTIELIPPPNAHGIIRLPFAFPYDTLKFDIHPEDSLTFVGSSEQGGSTDWSFFISEKNSGVTPIDPEFQVGPGNWSY